MMLNDVRCKPEVCPQRIPHTLRHPRIPAYAFEFSLSKTTNPKTLKPRTLKPNYNPKFWELEVKITAKNPSVFIHLVISIS